MNESRQRYKKLNNPLPIGIYKHTEKWLGLTVFLILQIFSFRFSYAQNQVPIPDSAAGFKDQKKQECLEMMFNLKGALINFNNDMGKFPIVWEWTFLDKMRQKIQNQVESSRDSLVNWGWKSLSGFYVPLYIPSPKPSRQSYFLADEALLGTATNVLAAPCPGISTMMLNPAVYSIRWKGPYLKGTPEKFMLDPWGTKIRYELARDSLYLHLAGPDGKFEIVEDCETEPGKFDDIIFRVSRLKF